MADAHIPATWYTLEQQLNTRWVARPLRVLAAVDSTNRILKDGAAHGETTHGMTILANHQTGGRGRLGRSWSSPPGSGIYASVALSLDPERLSGVLSLVAGVAMTEAVRDVTGLPVGLKWPNDGVGNGRKYAGILVEAGAFPSPWAIIGFGINVLGVVPHDLPNATNLETLAERPWDRAELFLRLMERFEAWYDLWILEGDEPIVARWSELTVTLGHLVQVMRPGQPAWVGRALVLDRDGGLWIENDTGERIKVLSGEVSLRLENGEYAATSKGS